MRFTARTVRTCTSLFQTHTPSSFPGEKSLGDVGALFAVLRSECDFGGNGDGADNLEAPGDIGERIVQIATTGAGFRRGRFTGRLAVWFWGVGAGEILAAVQIAMIAGLPYTALRDAVLTHPTLVEGLIPLFSSAASAHNVVETRGATT